MAKDEPFSQGGRADTSVGDDQDEPITLEGGDEAPPPDETPNDDEPIRLVEGGEPGSSEGQVRAFGAAAGGHAKQSKQYKRPLNVTGQGATRCRLFHSKIAETPLEHLQDSINDWLDDEQIEVKHVGHVIGTMEGKRPEPNLLVMVWY
ncbi:MAG: hypothetical protein KGY99_04315 [Phycisphaerae bacterium]|nr:hypothetical protein [Phycisphaerae bacterium]